MGIRNSSAEVLGPFCTLHFALWIELVEPEVVATSPYPIKSRVPVCCGFSSTKLVGERGVGFPKPCRMDAPSETVRYRELQCTSKAHRFSICAVCYSL